MKHSAIVEHAERYELKDVGEILRRQAAKRPLEPAIYCEERATDYQTLHTRSRQLALYLGARLRGSSQRVAFIGRECEAYYEVLFGCALAGAVFVPINWRLTPPEVAHILSDAGIALLFCDAATLPVVVDSLSAAGSGAEVVCLSEGLTATDYGTILRTQHERPLAPARVNPDNPFCIIYTSGTTGLPKGVSLRHQAFFEIRDALISHELTWLDWYSSDRSLVGIPGFHIGGLWWALQSFSAGAAIVVLPQFDPRTCLEAMRRHGVSIACLVPAMINLLLGVVEQDDARLPQLRKVVYGGAPISAALLERGLRVLGCDFAQIYGLSETGNTAVCLDPSSHRPELLQAAGRPYPGVRLKIIDSAGLRLPAGQVGEVCIETPARMTGYWGLKGATEAVLRGTWIHTGDAGYLNDDGYLFIQDRIKDVIVSGGEKISPTEVENVVSSFPSIHECAVVGVPDEDWGEVPICLVVSKSEASFDVNELYRYLAGRLAPFKRPTQVHCVDSLPRNPSGKLLRRELRDAFWTNRERRV